MKTQQAYIADFLRSPVSNVRKGKSAYTGIHPVDLSSVPVKEIVRRNNLTPDLIDELRWAVTTPIGKQWKIGRFIAIVGLSEKVPGSLELREGSSGVDAVVSGIGRISLGLGNLIIAGGSEDMSIVPLGADGYPIVDDEEILKRTKEKGVQIVRESLPESFLKNHDFKTTLESAEIIAKKWGLTRKELDEFALESHKKASAAWDKGFFEKEVLPIQTTSGLFKQDDGVRKDIKLEKLEKLNPIFQDGLITPGNASPLSVGASCILISSEDYIQKYNLTRRAKLIGYSVVGTNVEEQLTGPIYAIPKALENAGLELKDIDLFQISEAFASEVLATQKELKLPPEKINVNGGQISIGHPPGATGINLIISGINELERRVASGEPNNKYLLVTLCIGFGQGVAAIFERV